MKFILTSIIVILCASAARAETVTLTLSPVLPLPAGATVKAKSATITLAEGDVAELLLAPIPVENDYDDAERRTVEFVTAGQTFSWQTIVVPPGSSSTSSYIWAGVAKIQPLKVAGPGTLRLTSTHADTKTAVTFGITRANAIPSVTPSNAVVIPNDAAGTYQVILESSTDLITWTAANPGSYSGTTQQRFFRTRVLKQ